MNTNKTQIMQKVFKLYTDDQFVMRKVEPGDYYKGYFEILSQLTDAPKSEYYDFVERLKDFDNAKYLHLAIVIEDLKRKKIVAAGTVMVEPKIIRGLAKAGHIEDIVVDGTYRGKNFGKKIVDALALIAFQVEGIYKMILDCSQKNVPFYEKINYKNDGIQMTMRKSDFENTLLKLSKL